MGLKGNSSWGKWGEKWGTGAGVRDRTAESYAKDATHRKDHPCPTAIHAISPDTDTGNVAGMCDAWRPLLLGSSPTQPTDSTSQPATPWLSQWTPRRPRLGSQLHWQNRYRGSGDNN